MSTKNDLLIELGSEELPPKALLALSQSFANFFKQQLAKAGLEFSAIKPFATPRRLALLIEGLASQQQDQQQERLGPAVAAAYDKNGQPTPAALGFAKSCGVDLDQLDKIDTPKGVRLGTQLLIKGKTIEELLPALLDDSLKQLPVPKLMRWGESTAQFARPVHWLILLYGSKRIETECLGLISGQTSMGHRFHHPDPLLIEQASDYQQLLAQAKVLVDFEQRKQRIIDQATTLGAEINGQVIIDEGLLEEVSALVEWPHAILGRFDESFLAVPKECLISAMKEHQKYFYVVDKDGELLPYFVTIANIGSNNVESVRSGNEKVIRPRLADAMFFFEQDKKRKLAERFSKLEEIIFQKSLGSIADKSRRVERLAKHITATLGGDETLCERAAHLAKCDLVSEMVGEFPELQGIMGRYYALHDGEADEVARAIEAQYLPRFAGDSLPTETIAIALAIAEKMDTIVGIMGIGQIPSGTKDPFGLRRAALGILRIIIENQLPLNMEQLIEQSLAGYSNQSFKADTASTIFKYIQQRLKAFYQDQNIDTKVINAILNKNVPEPLDFDARIHSLVYFTDLPESAALAAATKRVGNILRKESAFENTTFVAALLTEQAEKQLADALLAVPDDSGSHFKARLSALASLRDPVDHFFDNVMVNVDDQETRKNRLCLLAALYQTLTAVADISTLDT